jgi:hypothetical protein
MVDDHSFCVSSEALVLEHSFIFTISTFLFYFLPFSTFYLFFLVFLAFMI